MIEAALLTFPGPAFHLLDESLPIEAIVDDYNRQENRLTLFNDAEITLGSADKYARYAGAAFGAVWMDEPSHYGETLHDLTG